MAIEFRIRIVRKCSNVKQHVWFVFIGKGVFMMLSVLSHFSSPCQLQRIIDCWINLPYPIAVCSSAVCVVCVCACVWSEGLSSSLVVYLSLMINRVWGRFLLRIGLYCRVHCKLCLEVAPTAIVIRSESHLCRFWPYLQASCSILRAREFADRLWA